MDPPDIDEHQKQTSAALSTAYPRIAGVEILEIAGVGGMGTVYKARQVALDRIVAVKVLHKNLLRNSTVVQRFAMEAKLATSLSHPNIVSVLAFGKCDDEGGQPYLLMDYLVGTSFKDYLAERGAINKSECAELFSQICSALEHAHAVGVVHRDLKPANVWLIPTEDGSNLLKVLDFGIAKVLQDDEVVGAQKLTQTGAVIGSPSYMSPEQCTGGAIDARSDIYSVGCMLFEVLTGAPPFVGDSILETMSKQLSEPVGKMRDAQGRAIDEGLERVVRRAMEKQPQARYQSATELLADLRNEPAARKIGESGGTDDHRIPRDAASRSILSSLYLNLRELSRRREAWIILVVVPLIVCGVCVVSHMVQHEKLSDCETLMDSGKFGQARAKLLAILKADGMDAMNQAYATDMLNQLAMIYANEADESQAEKLLERTSVFAFDRHLRPELTDSQRMLARILFDRQKIEESDRILRTLSTTQDSLRSAAAVSLVKMQLAKNLRWRSNKTLAIGALEDEAVASARRSQRADRLLTVLLERWDYQVAISKHHEVKEALSHAKRAAVDFAEALSIVPIAEREGTREAAAGIGSLSTSLEKNDPRVLSLGQKALDIYARKQPAHATMMKAYRHMSVVYGQIPDRKMQLRYMDLAAAEAEKTRDVERLATLKVAGDLQYYFGNIGLATDYYSRAMACPMIDTTLAVRLNAMTGYATCLLRLNKVQEANKVFHQVLSMGEEHLNRLNSKARSPTPPSLWSAMFDTSLAIGASYVALGDLTKAKNTYLQIVKTIEEARLEDPTRDRSGQLALVYNCLADLNSQQHNTAEAAEYMRKAMSCWQRILVADQLILQAAKLGELQFLNKDYSGCLDTCLPFLSTVESTKGPGSSAYVWLPMLVADSYAMQSRFALAQPIYDRDRAAALANILDDKLLAETERLYKQTKSATAGSADSSHQGR